LETYKSDQDCSKMHIQEALTGQNSTEHPAKTPNKKATYTITLEFGKNADI